MKTVRGRRELRGQVLTLLKRYFVMRFGVGETDECAPMNRVLTVLGGSQTKNCDLSQSMERCSTARHPTPRFTEFGPFAGGIPVPRW